MENVGKEVVDLWNFVQLVTYVEEVVDWQMVQWVAHEEEEEQVVNHLGGDTCRGGEGDDNWFIGVPSGGELCSGGG